MSFTPDDTPQLEPISPHHTTRCLATPPETQTTQPCAICLERLAETNDGTWIALECGHKFHCPCILKSFRYSPRCPMCRDDPQTESYQQRSREYNTLMRIRRQVLRSPELGPIMTLKRNVRARSQTVRNQLQQQMQEHGEIYNRIVRLRRRKERLSRQAHWCETRIRAELLRHSIPLNLRRPVPPPTLLAQNSR